MNDGQLLDIPDRDSSPNVAHTRMESQKRMLHVGPPMFTRLDRKR